MARPSKRATKIRTASEFSRLPTPARPNSASPVFAWELEDIYRARQRQMQGLFAYPKQLADAMRSDDALFVAYQNRLAPLRCLECRIDPASQSAKARAIAGEAEALFGVSGVGITSATIANIHGCLVNHGVAFGAVDYVTREDGSRSDAFLKYWPIEHVRWDEVSRSFVTRTSLDDGGDEVEICHGDGRWVVFSPVDHEPWLFGCLPAAALVWGRHAFGNRDWLAGSRSHGNAKVMGELPEGVALQDNEGALTPEAAAFIELLSSIAGDAPAGIRPAGSKTEYLTNSSNAWQVWSELVNGAEKAAARIYLGTDGILGSQGGAPGVDIESLFGVAATIVQADILAIERGIREGVIEPWCAINFGDSTLAPKRVYVVPDGDTDAATESYAKRRQSFFDDIARATSLGFELKQVDVDDLAKRYSVEPVILRPEDNAAVEALAKREQAFFEAVDSARRAGFEISQAWVDATAASYCVASPTLPQAANKAPTIMLAPTDVVEWITPNEVRAASGLGPQLLPDGTLDPSGFVQIKKIRADEERAQSAESTGG